MKNFENGSYQQLLYAAFALKDENGDYINGNPYIMQEIVRERNAERANTKNLDERTL